jgi:all-trans-retinol 13,14-reductase
MAQSYRREKPGGPFDAIIIGSGMSGLATAALLSRSGKRCLVLEKHYTPGGFTHVFKRRDYEWDVGIHYIGDVHRPRTTLRRIFDHITDGSLRWADMGDVYDRIVIGDRPYDFRSGREAFQEGLGRHFHESRDRKAIASYVDLIREASASANGLFMGRVMPKVLRTVATPFLGRKARRFARLTTREVMDGLTANPELKAVLTGQFGDYGLPPSQSSFLMHALLAKHYLNGGAYPVGGSSSIFNRIEPVIESAGGKVFVRAGVDSILHRNGKAHGVLMEDGTELHAPIVISSAGLPLTYGKLLRNVKGTAEMTRRIEGIGRSSAHLCLYLGLKETPEQLGLPKTNLWLYPDNPDHDRNVSEYLKDPDNSPLPLVYASFPAAKDPQFQERFPGRSTIELITLADHSRFAEWEGTEWNKRGTDYEAVKEKMKQRMLERFFEVMPHIRGRIDHAELSTPLSTRHFLSHPHGEIYGLNHTPERFLDDSIGVRSPLSGLYLTGQDIVSCGIGGALASAMMTSSVILRKNLFNALRRNG